MLEGRCHCGAIAYQLTGEPLHHAICHCGDCRRHAGAPMVSWAMFKSADVTVTKGVPKVYESSAHGRRHFCETCGTGVLYVNEQMLPGMVDVQTATLDEPNAMQPQIHIQTAERLAWAENMHNLPSFERFPPQS